jgi:Ca2+-binding RTX toxin-like protein
VFPALPAGLAVQGGSVYWANFGSATIGRANIDGTGAEGSFIVTPPQGSVNVGVAVDANAAACAGSEATIVGTGRPDEPDATNGGDVIAAGNGGDTVAGGGGGDVVCGGGGADRLGGGAGSGGSGGDMISGGPGNDTVSGGSGSDMISGGPGNDTVSGGPGGDTVNGGPGSDKINARDGDADRINCGAGTDTVTLDSKDTIVGASSQNSAGSRESVVGQG